MERLLSTAMNRRVLLLNLLGGSNHWMTSEKLADLIQCSSKSVMLDCQYIEERWSEYLTVETSKKNGLRFITSPHHSIHTIYREIIQESSAFELLEAVFFNPRETAAFWQQELFLSNSSLYRISNLIAKSLGVRKIELNRSPYSIVSNDERQVRYFFTSYFIEVYGIHQWPFPVSETTVLSLAQRINEDFRLALNDVQLMHLAFSIVVTMIRERQGFLIEHREDVTKDFHKEVEEVQNYQSQVAEIAGELGVELPEVWYEDFCFSIFWWNFGWDNPQERKNIFRQADELVETIKNALEITASKESKKSMIRLIEHIYAKHKMYPYKKYMIYDRYSYSSKAIKQNYIVFTEVVTKALKEWEKRTKFPWYSMYIDEILHEVMIRWESLPNLLDGLRHQVSIAVLSDLGKEHAQLLGSYLKDNFSKRIQIHLQEDSFYDKMEDLKQQQFDLYVANYSVQQVPEDNLIIVEDIPSFKDLTDLRKFIDRRRLVLPESIPYLNQ